MVKIVAGGWSIEDPSALVGRRIADRYRVAEIIGRGGMSVVFRGKDERLDRTVAIKVFAELFVGPSARVSYQHFVQEAFALSRLNHPHTLRIYDFAVLDEGERKVPFQVAEYMDGGTLGQFITSKGAQPISRALHLMECLSGAVAEAHSHNIIHRDIKPSNILFGRAGRQRIVKLADFSVAQACLDASQAVRSLGDQTLVTHASFWTLNWSPPEQVRGGQVGFQADIYSLGLTLAYLLAGRPVWSHENPGPYLTQDKDQLDQALRKALTRLRVPERLLEPCYQACRADPDERFASVEQFHGAVVRAATARASKPKVADKSASEEATSPWIEATPAPPPAEKNEPPRGVELLLEDLDHPDVLASGRRMRLKGVEDAVFDVEGVSEGGADAPGGQPVRLRITLLPAIGSRTRVHLRGMNCFVRRAEAVPTLGVDVAENVELELVGMDRSRLAGLSLSPGERGADHWTLSAPDLQLKIPASLAENVLILRFSSSTEVLLIHQKPKE